MSESSLIIKIKAVDNVSGSVTTASFLLMYRQLTSIEQRGFKGGFIRPKIAKHCGVTENTVSGWIAGKRISEPCAKLLQSFEVE